MNKKRILGMFGACLMLTAGLSITANAETLVGDHNGDGVVNAKDAAVVLQYAAEIGSGNFKGTLPEYVQSHSSQTAPAESTSLDYNTIYHDYLYDTLVPKKGRADMWAEIVPKYDLKNIIGVVGSKIYDFDQDGVKELLVITRELFFNEYGDVTTMDTNYCYVNTSFVLNLYQADADGKVKLLDWFRLPENHSVASSTGEQGEEVEMMISGNAVYQKSSTREYGSSGPDCICNEYNIIDVTGGKFTPYKLTVNSLAVYDATGTEPHHSFDGTLLYTDQDILNAKTFTYEYPLGKYTSLADINDEINQQLKNHHLDFNSAKLSVINIEDDYDYLYLDIDVNSGDWLMSYSFPDDEADVRTTQHLTAAMIEEWTMEE